MNYVNLNSITLYKTYFFNQKDTLLFNSEIERDTFFDNIDVSNKLLIDEFSDLYEGRLIRLPYNYLDLKKYNMMKLVYNDGLGHNQTYYCLIDDYYYVSSECCTPIYKVDYWITFGHLLANQNLKLSVDRRTGMPLGTNKFTKADLISIPKLKYIKHNIAVSSAGEIENVTKHYIIYLNNTSDNEAKLGFTVNFRIWNQAHDLSYICDTYTIGCYVCVCDDLGLTQILQNEPAEYIEKIIEAPGKYDGLGTSQPHAWGVNRYYYITQDFDAFYRPILNDTDLEYSWKSLYGDTTPGGGVENYDPHECYKPIMNRLNCKGIVVQGQEFDPHDYDTNKPTDFYYDNVAFSFLGMCAFYPLGYRGEIINRDYSVMWTYGRIFSYASDYTNSLSYKEAQELNAQAVKNANKNASLNTYYEKLIAENEKNIIDVTKKQNDKSLEAQINNLNNQIASLKDQSIINDYQQYHPVNFVKNIWSNLTGGGRGAESILKASDINRGISSAYNEQTLVTMQRLNNDKLYELQLNANNLNSKLKCDLIALARDNTIANLAIESKYNNAHPGAYYETDFTKFTNYIYHIVIDDDYGRDLSQRHLIENYYNVNGIFNGHIEVLNLSNPIGLYFTYIQANIVDESSELINNIDHSIYMSLLSRLQEGVRIWHDLNYFGNLIYDNTFTGADWTSEAFNVLKEPKTNLNDSDKATIKIMIKNYMYVNLYDIDTINSYINSVLTTSDEKAYAHWYNNTSFWGYPLENSDETKLINLITLLAGDFTLLQYRDILLAEIPKMTDITIRAKQFLINYLNNL